jgi:peptidoglycan-associated lipoprotein
MPSRICSNRSALVLALLLFSLAACRSKGGDAPSTPGPGVTTAPRTTASTTPPSANGGGGDAEDIWSRDLDAINEHVRRTGLLGDVYFEYDDAGLSAAARERLAANARFLSERPEFVVTIEGHCDERGTTEYNLALGERRAQSALGYVQSLGVGADRQRRLSYGKERPVCSESVESCWSRNRRAHFVITGRHRPT